ncbi:unnamed protein product [Rotaria magnacalcarata]|uniref:Uncharacterized protein n=1 Tax=Rotaria magnacalcarata TaxID=392030 RepID=A0A818XNK0_9BILA|nr:unnamed protein product [Rotaria magnacalcarata]CAF3851483.1 unnamed protein product [Rotaria magnacalcarata]CAF3865275.1 unnamed protein product [Rotaria magnacalcarata]CAF4015184.1 unnamed protein product [Rotaria magnacalcarata]CAF4411467.1 unnamed protein product [Rotaria magnacalcarata]
MNYIESSKIQSTSTENVHVKLVVKNEAKSTVNIENESKQCEIDEYSRKLIEDFSELLLKPIEKCVVLIQKRLE